MLMNSNAVELLVTAYKFKKRKEICQCVLTTCCIINVYVIQHVVVWRILKKYTKKHTFRVQHCCFTC